MGVGNVVLETNQQHYIWMYPKTGGHLLSAGWKRECETANGDRRDASRTGQMSPKPTNKRGRLSVPLIECAEMGNHGSGSRQRGSHVGGATKPILTDRLKGIIKRAGAKREGKREGKRKTAKLICSEKWLRQQRLHVRQGLHAIGDLK